MTLENNAMTWDWLKLLCVTIIATLVVEHSQLDIRISELFYNNGHWLLEKGAQPYAFIFYDLPKALLILLAVYLIAVLIIKYRRPLPHAASLNRSKFGTFLMPLPVREISYLLIILALVPATIAMLKGVTHVSCPNDLVIFNGDLPYLNLWQNIVAATPAKCFPAAHASAGFSLYGLAFLPTLKKYRYQIFTTVTILGWTMGVYKMLFGDHFFSHTLVSMLLSLTIACALAALFFKQSIKNKVNSTRACPQFKRVSSKWAKNS
ncbi:MULTISPECIES: PAP2 family lipid A phosphatase [unclassified Psychrobacter]|uniref:PAP2 family lipid A phosphatase n=1 Tax=unclassified Psychrobacter TaxID=196806 RepID=UPI0025B4467D|nr:MULTISPECIES: PAP2 family lipid A phosphatase [unclassified Psychrobacter]MDN3452992.1 PAP2 family lipid A phosphatase [Psychrobacter sp. APC 3350]MDN3502989.1 PAP2 family lipid A phosphatase [Psychrobacter sp. 5A.1]